MCLEKLNSAARHRNVYLDAVGGDPYGKCMATIQHLPDIRAGVFER